MGILKFFSKPWGPGWSPSTAATVAATWLGWGRPRPLLGRGLLAVEDVTNLDELL